MNRKKKRRDKKKSYFFFAETKVFLHSSFICFDIFNTLLPINSSLASLESISNARVGTFGCCGVCRGRNHPIAKKDIAIKFCSSSLSVARRRFPSSSSFQSLCS